LNTGTFPEFYVENKRGNFYMTKNILAIAIAAAVMAPSAFAAATVYGVAHESINSISNVSSTAANGGASSGLTSISSNSSRLGIKGSEDLSGGMKAVYQMEFGIAMDGNGNTATTGATANNDTIGTSLRNTFVGLGGGFGTVLVGRHDSLIKMTGRKYDVFGDQIGNNRNALNGGSSAGSALVDGRHNNVLAYISPTWSGFHFGLAYVPSSAANGAETYDTTAVAKTNALTAIADYTAGAFSVTGGYINIDNATGVNGNAFTAYRLGAGYTFGAAKVVGLYQNAGVSGSKQDAYGLGGTYKVGAAGTIKGQYYTMADVNGGKVDGTLTTVGYDHSLSKNTTAYVVYAAAHNGANATYTTNMGNGGAGSNVFAAADAGGSKDNSALSVGLIHNF
jgi:predicted porin